MTTTTDRQRVLALLRRTHARLTDALDAGAWDDETQELADLASDLGEAARAVKVRREHNGLRAELTALRHVLADRERELLDLKGPCSNTRWRMSTEGPTEVWAVVHSNYEPAEVDGLYADEELATRRAQELGGDWHAERWPVHGRKEQR